MIWTQRAGLAAIALVLAGVAPAAMAQTSGGGAGGSSGGSIGGTSGGIGGTSGSIGGTSSTTPSGGGLNPGSATPGYSGNSTAPSQLQGTTPSTAPSTLGSRPTTSPETLTGRVNPLTGAPCGPTGSSAGVTPPSTTGFGTPDIMVPENRSATATITPPSGGTGPAINPTGTPDSATDVTPNSANRSAGARAPAAGLGTSATGSAGC